MCLVYYFHVISVIIVPWYVLETRGHSTIAVASLVPNYVVNCMYKRQHCASLFIDLLKAFDTVDHSLLIQRLSSIGLDQAPCIWCKNDLTDRTQCVSTVVPPLKVASYCGTACVLLQHSVACHFVVLHSSTTASYC
jgi:hypothetical protein